MIFIALAAAATATLWTIAVVLAPPGSALRTSINALIPILIFSVFAVIFSVKANNGLPDRLIYTNELQSVAGRSMADALNLTFHTKREPLYLIFMWLVSRGGETTVWLYFWVGLASVLTYVIAMLKLVPSWQAPLVWLTTLSLGFFTSYASLVARQGLSMAVLFAAICLILTGLRTRWWIGLLIASGLLHWSAIPIAVAIALATLLRVRLRVAVIAWGVASVLFLAGVQERVLGPVAGLVPGLNDYVNAGLNSAYRGGVNRRDFFLFSLGILVVGLLTIRRGAPTPWYPRLVVIYCTLNIYFLLFGFILYSDRLAAYSWTLGPLILAIPFANPRSTVERFGSVAFVVAIIGFGFAAGPFSQMTGITPY